MMGLSFYFLRAFRALRVTADLKIFVIFPIGTLRALFTLLSLSLSLSLGFRRKNEKRASLFLRKPTNRDLALRQKTTVKGSVSARSLAFK